MRNGPGSAPEMVPLGRGTISGVAAVMCLFVGCRPATPVPPASVSVRFAPPPVQPPTVFGPTFRELKKDLGAQTIILTYHDILPERDSKSQWFDCTKAELIAQLDWMTKRGAHFISLQTLYDHLTTGKSLPNHPVVITFADNYHGFLEYAYDILRERKIPTAMFVHTGFVGSPIGRPKMTWDELEKLDKQGLVTVASQTVTHPEDLRNLSDEQLQKEMVRSRRDLETHLGHRVQFLAYPNGKYDDRVAAAARAATYSMAFTETQVLAERSPSILMVSRYVHTKLPKAWQDQSP